MNNHQFTKPIYILGAFLLLSVFLFGGFVSPLDPPVTAASLDTLATSTGIMTVGLVAGSGYVPVVGYTSYTGVDLSSVGASEIYGVTPDGTVVQLTPDVTDPDLHFSDKPAGTYYLYVHQTVGGWLKVAIVYPPASTTLPVDTTPSTEASGHGGGVFVKTTPLTTVTPTAPAPTAPTPAAPTPGFFAGITGAVIGALGTGGSIAVLVFVVLVVLLAVLAARQSRVEAKAKKE